MTIHAGNPFADEPDPVRRFRGRLGGAVSLWTSGSGAHRTGLTVSSLMVANGDPARVLGLLDPDADLAEALTVSSLAVVQLLTWSDRLLAEAFAGVGPAPGGPFTLGTWEQTEHGPLLTGRTHARVRVESLRPVGWSTEVVGVVESLVISPDPEGLEHRRGRYRRTSE